MMLMIMVFMVMMIVMVLMMVAMMIFRVIVFVGANLWIAKSVVIFGFPFNYPYGIYRTVTDAGTKTVAIGIGDKLCLAIYHLYCTFGAGICTLSAAITFFFIYLDDFSQHLSPCGFVNALRVVPERNL